MVEPKQKPAGKPVHTQTETGRQACPHGGQSPPATNRHARRLAAHPRRHPSACRGGTPGRAVSGSSGSGGTCRGCGRFRGGGGCWCHVARREKDGASGGAKAQGDTQRSAGGTGGAGRNVSGGSSCTVGFCAGGRAESDTLCLGYPQCGTAGATRHFGTPPTVGPACRAAKLAKAGYPGASLSANLCTTSPTGQNTGRTT